MTRTRQSTAHGRRGAFRKEALSVKKKVNKPKNTPAQKPVKGRYTCLKCMKFNGPRRAVEDHCRNKHKLTAKKLDSAVGIISDKNISKTKIVPLNKLNDVGEEKPTGAKKIPQDNSKDESKTPHRSSKRSRSISEAVDNGDKAVKRNGGEPNDKSTVIPQEISGNKSMKPDAREEISKKDKEFQKAPSSSEEKLDDIRDENPASQTDESGKDRESALSNTDETSGDTENTLGVHDENQAFPADNKSVKESESALSNTDETSVDTENHFQVVQDENEVSQTDGSVKESKNYLNKTDEISIGTENDSHEDLVDNGSSTPKKSLDYSENMNVSHNPDETTQKVAGKEENKDTQSTPLATSVKAPEKLEGSCQKCKRTFSKPRQLLKHKCFAAMDDEPLETPKRKPAPSNSKPRKTPIKSVKGQKTPKSVERAKQRKRDKNSSDRKDEDKKDNVVIVPAIDEEEYKTREQRDVLASVIIATTGIDHVLLCENVVEKVSEVDPPPPQENSEGLPENSTGEKEEIAPEPGKETRDPPGSGDLTGESTSVKENAVQENDTGSKDEEIANDHDIADIKPVQTKKKGVRPSRANKYERLTKSMNELPEEDKDKIIISNMLRQYTSGMSLVGASDKVQLSVQNGGAFCLCSFCSAIYLTQDQMKEHLCQHLRDYFPFQCQTCDFLSRKRGRMTAHMKKAHGGYLQCQFCSYNTYDQDKLNRHYKYWNRDFSNSCQFCHKKVAEGTKEEHMKSVHGKKAEELVNINLTADAFTCRYCGERQKSRHARRDHEKRHDPHYTCPLCPYTTNGESAFVNHGRKHRVILVCSECLTKFHSSQALKDHLQVHNTQDVSSVQSDNLIQLMYERSISQSIFVASALDEAAIPECDIIGLDMNMRVREEERRVSQQISGSGITGRPISLVATVEEMNGLNFGIAYDVFMRNIEYRHLSMQTLSFMFARYGKRECSYCGFLLHSLGSWKIHTGSHEGTTDLHCTECNYKCRHKFLLDRHILITHKKQDFGCDLCSKRFPYREYVYLHKRKDHYGGRMTCSFCVDTEFATEDEKVMKRHIIEEHPEMTSKQIAQIIGRKVHFTGRDGILFVKCKYCQKGFNRAAFLRQHVQLVHFKQKSFLCDQCGYKSNTSARLRTHMAVHTEKRDVTCDQCGAGFKNKVYLYKHIRRSHKRYATARGAAYCKRTRLKNMISLLQKERQEGSSYERQEIIQKEKAKLFGFDRSSASVEGVRVKKTEPLDIKPNIQPPTQINVYQCGDCGEYFENIPTLKNHFTNVHGESPNIPLDFDAGTCSGTSDLEQVNIALDALNNGNSSNLVNQLFQCAKCNRMFPDMKTVEHHVKAVHATDTFLISEGNIPTQELDLAAEVINHLTRETNQSGQIDVMQNVISQSAIDALSIEAQDAASALTSLPDSILDSSNLQAQVDMQPTVTYQIKTEEGPIPVGDGTASTLNILSQELNNIAQGGSDANIPPKIEVVVSGRDDELEAAQLLQQMGIFQQFATSTSAMTTPSGLQLTGSAPLQIEEHQGAMEGGSVTIMVIEDNPQSK